MRDVLRSIVLSAGAAGLLAGGAHAAEQTILGKSIVVRDRPGDPGARKIRGRAKEPSSPNTVVGNPTSSGGAGGAVLTVLAYGATATSQTFTLLSGTSRSGTPFWSGDPTRGFRYKDARGEQGAVKSVTIRKAANGRFTIEVSLTAKNGPVVMVPPNPGTDACFALQLGVNGTSGDRYSVQFGSESAITNVGDRFFKAKGPVNEGVCPAAPTTTTTTTTFTPSTMIDRCCVDGLCLRLNPPGCSTFGGVPIGDGSCDPNPCPTTTPTTSTTTTTVGSPSGAFLESPPNSSRAGSSRSFARR